MALGVNSKRLHGGASIAPGVTAVNAGLLVDTDYSPALRAPPALLLQTDEAPKPKLSNAFEVLDHAHPVLGTVSLVQLAKPGTGKTGALETESPPGSPDLVAVLDVAHQAVLCRVRSSGVAAHALIYQPEVGDTDAAVHPTRRNQRRTKRLWILNLTNTRGQCHPSISRPLPGPRVTASPASREHRDDGDLPAIWPARHCRRRRPTPQMLPRFANEDQRMW